MAKKQRHVVLVEPEIPQNTGNIARTCAATGSTLHLIQPMGFSLDDRYVKRAGLDYWPHVDLQVHDDWDAFAHKYSDAPMFFVSTKGPICYTEIDYEDPCFLIFGKETKGLDAELLRQNIDRCIRIPMIETLRSLNLANSVAIVLYESYRKSRFEGFVKEGMLDKWPSDCE